MMGNLETMPRQLIRLADSKVVLASNAVEAVSWWMRLRGMIGRRFSSQLDAMCFKRCNAIHCSFMSCRIDVLFIDRSGRTVKCCNAVRPWAIAFGGSDAVTAIEFPAGKLQQCAVKPGDLVEFIQAEEERNARKPEKF